MLEDLLNATETGKGEAKIVGMIKVKNNFRFLGKDSKTKNLLSEIPWLKKYTLLASPNQNTVKAKIKLIQCQMIIPKNNINNAINKLLVFKLRYFQSIIKALIERLMTESRKVDIMGIFLKLI